MRFRRAFEVAAPQAAVAEFHRGAAGFRALRPPLVPMRLHGAPERLAAGDEMDFTMWLGPLPVRWVARIEETGPGGFVDRQIRGPFASWLHRHRFEARGAARTLVVDEIEARLRRHPIWGPAGWLLWAGLPPLFAWRAFRTRRLLEAGSSARPARGG